MSETVEINIAEIKQKLYHKLKPSGWGDKLKGFILSSEFDTILEELQRNVESGLRFTPPLRQVFRAFEECPYRDLKVVFILQCPYPRLGQADGIAMSCSNLGMLQPSLIYVYKAVEQTVYNGEKYHYNPDLKHWANQGILMLNTALTTTLNVKEGHYDIWKPFMCYLLDILGSYNPGLIYVFLGKIAEPWAKSIPSSNYKLFASHPASAAYKKSEKWECEDIFNTVNSILLRNNNQKITW